MKKAEKDTKDWLKKSGDKVDEKTRKIMKEGVDLLSDINNGGFDDPLDDEITMF